MASNSPEDPKETIRREIQSRIKETHQTIESLKDQVKPVEPDRAIGRITRMDAIQQKSMADANLQAAQLALHNLEDALSKLDDPTFGLCIRCHNPIPLERILIVPESKCCVQCAA